MNDTLTCSRCGNTQARSDARLCSSCGLSLGAPAPPAPEVHAALFAEVARRARESAWNAHVPTNRFVERQHRALRTAIAMIASSSIVLLPAAWLINRAAQAQFDLNRAESAFLGTLLLAVAAVCVLLAGGAFTVAYRILRSFLAYRRAPLERCPAFIVAKRRVPLGKRGGVEIDFVTLEFANGEQREYRADKAAYEVATERNAALAYLRANHLLDLKLVPA